jgi:hypothetical protein
VNREKGMNWRRVLKPPIRTIALAILGYGTLFSAIIFAFATNRPRLSMGEPTQIADQRASDLWFTDKGELVAVGQQNRTIWTRIWLPHEETSQKLAFEIPSTLGVPSYSLRTTPDKPPPPPVHAIPYAISEDGKRVAWSENRHIYSKFLEGPATQPQEFSVDSDIAALAFISDDSVAILDTNGRIRLGSLSSRQIIRERIINIDGATGLWARKGRLALTLFLSGDVIAVDLNALKAGPQSEIKTRSYSNLSNGVSVTIGEADQLAIGTSNNYVITPNSSMLSSSPFGTGAINDIAFYDNTSIIAGGDFPGIFLIRLEKGITPLKLSPIVGIQRLAVTADRIAFSTATSVSVAELHEGREFMADAGDSLKLAFWLVSLLGFTLSLIRDGQSRSTKNSSDLVPLASISKVDSELNSGNIILSQASLTETAKGAPRE